MEILPCIGILQNVLYDVVYNFWSTFDKLCSSNLECVKPCMNACMSMSVCFRHDSVCKLDNHSVITKVAGVGHDLPAGSPTDSCHPTSARTSLLFSSLLILIFFPYCISQSSYFKPFPFSSGLENQSFTIHSSRWLQNIPYSDWSFLFQIY